jgi:O-antigen/teichoic acid export membrane protein
MPERFGRNTVSSMALSVTLMVVALVTTPLLTKHLGHERYGIWVLVVSIVQYLELLELGFAGATVATIARHHASGDRRSLDRTVNTTFFTLIPLGFVALLVSVGLAVVLPSLVHVSPALVSATRWLVLLLGIDIVVSIPMDTFGGGLVAIHRFDILNATLIAVAVARAVAWTLVLVFGGSLVMLGIVTVTIGLCGQLARALCFARLVPGLKIHPRHFEREVLRTLARPAGWFAVGGFVTNFRDYARIFLLGIVKSVVTSGIFAVGETLAILGLKVQGPATQQFFPHAAGLMGRQEEAGLAGATKVGSRIAVATTVPLCLVVAVLARPAIVAWVGPTYAGAAVGATLLAVAFGLDSLATIPRQVLMGSGNQRLPALIMVAATAFEVILLLVLGSLYGIAGAGVAALVSVVAIELGLTPMVCRRVGVPPLAYLLGQARAHLLPILCAGIVGWALSVGPVATFVAHHHRLAGMAVVVAAGMAVLAVYAVVFAFSGLDSTERGIVLRRLTRRGSSPQPTDDVPGTGPGAGRRRAERQDGTGGAEGAR